MRSYDGVDARPSRPGHCVDPTGASRPPYPSSRKAYLDHWEERWADTRIHGTTKRQMAVMLAEEKPALGELPLEPFR